MRVVAVILAASLAANAAWALTVAFSGSRRQAALEPSDEPPATSSVPSATGTGVRAPSVTSPENERAAGARARGTSSAPATRRAPATAGAAPKTAPAVRVPLPDAPEDRLAMRLGRMSTADELAALEKLRSAGASNVADHLAQEVAGRRGRDQALASGAGPLIDRALKSREAKKDGDAIRAALDFLAGHEFEAAFPAGGYGPTIAWDDVENERMTPSLADGTTIQMGAGEHELDLRYAVEALAFRPFPRDVTVVGAGPTKTLVRLRNRLRVTGPVVNFAFAAMSIELEAGELFDSATEDPVCLRFSKCRLSGQRGIEFRRGGAVWFDECEMDGAWARNGQRPVVGRADEALVRFDRCVVTLCTPLESRGVRAALLNGCSLREQAPRSLLEGGNVRLVATTVQTLATQENWFQRGRVAREFTLEKDPARPR